jgi:hypothetical protein
MEVPFLWTKFLQAQSRLKVSVVFFFRDLSSIHHAPAKTKYHVYMHEWINLYKDEYIQMSAQLGATHFVHSDADSLIPLIAGTALTARTHA